jgi:hypothetical protein
MKRNFLILFAGLTFMAVTAPAKIRPDLWPRGWHAGGPANEREATKAFNFLQDSLGMPNVDRVYVDDEKWDYVWKGPRTGKWMSMSGEEFEEDILEPYYMAQEMTRSKSSQNMIRIK